jgi:subtilisin family serine protease
MRRRICNIRLIKVLSFSLILFFFKFLNAGNSENVYWYLNARKVTFEINSNLLVYKVDSVKKDISDFNHPDLRKITIENQYGNSFVKLYTQNIDDKVKYAFSQHLSKENISAQSLLSIKYISSSQLSYQEAYLDGKLLVKFSNIRMPLNAIEQFVQQYDLKIINVPSEKLSQYGNYTYIFALNAEQTNEKNAATVAAKIYEENRNFLIEILPNLLNTFHPDGEVSAGNNAWHIDNQGQTNFCNVQAQQLCDTQISDVWNMGYTGQGIRIGIIDVHGFDFNHPDLSGQFLTGWDFVNNRPLNQNTFSATVQNQSHGMAVSGVVAASGKNSGGIAGVAYGAKIVPFLVDLSEASIIQALQKAMLPEYDVDILNCSFSGTGNNPLIEQEINNLTQFGRKRFEQNLGVVIVCSSGNDNMSDEFVPYYPAAYQNVISVTASTPEDKKKDFSDKWNLSSSWAPNYGKKLHIAAPGLCIPTTDYSGTTGYSSSNYISFSKTSSSAPIVAGVAALLLSKNLMLTFNEVKQKLGEGAEKTGGYNYNYDSDKPGHSKELGYGRVNAKKTLDGVSVGISENKQKSNAEINIVNPANTMLHINYDIAKVNGDVVLYVFDLSGNMVIDKTILPKDQTVFSVDINEISPGMYVSKFYIKEEEFTVTGRFIKIW